MANSSKRAKTTRPRPTKTTGLQAAKPFADFPLFVHKTGRWCKKITVDGQAKLYYFGRVADGWEAALNRYDAEKVDIAAGRTPSRDTKSDGVTVLDLCNAFMHAKKHKVECDKMSWRSFREYKASLTILMDTIGRTVAVEKLKPADFSPFELALSKRFGAVAQKNHITRVRSAFKFAVLEGLIEKAVNFGTRLAIPERRQVRLERAAKPDKVFEAAEARRLIAYEPSSTLADPTSMRAMVLLALNCGLGNDDCGRLTFAAINLESGWCSLHRNKTGTPRRAKLWPETIAALNAVIAKRRPPKDTAHSDRVFITKYGGSWSKEQTEESKSTDNPVAKAFTKLLPNAGVDGKGRGFYALRHTFFTVACDGGDQVAASSVMGHCDESMAAQYRHGISDSRLEKVSTFVRDWLFSGDEPQKNAEK